MPVDLSESLGNAADLVFPEDAEGTEFRLAEGSVYDAEEVREELEVAEDGTPAYGRWLRVTLDGGRDGWLCAPGELRKELVDMEAEPGEVFQVKRCQKAGKKQTDPYEVNLYRVSDPDQSRF